MKNIIKNPIKILWLAAAFISMALGAIGVILPVLPTTPFLLLASFCFAKGSERFHKWFTKTKLYKKHLDSFVKNRAMTLKTKLCILIPASCMLVLAMIANTYIPFVQQYNHYLTNIAKAGLTLTLFLIGCGLNRKTISSVGFKPLIQGVILWVIIATAALWAVTTLTN